jgi:hypothetical protein
MASSSAEQPIRRLPVCRTGAIRMRQDEGGVAAIIYCACPGLKEASGRQLTP